MSFQLKLKIDMVERAGIHGQNHILINLEETSPVDYRCFVGELFIVFIKTVNTEILNGSEKAT